MKGFLLDENLPRKLVPALQAEGHDVESVYTLRMQGLENGELYEFARDSFDWITPPVLNPYTRMAVEMCPARGVLRVVGYELQRGKLLPGPATLPCEVNAERLPA